MTFDPHETTVMPPIGDGFPITDELPAVRVPKSTPPWLIGAILVGLLLAAGGVLIAAVVLDNRSDSATTTEPTAEAAVPTAAFAPTAVPVAPTEPGYWQVVGVDEGLNVRSGPGTDFDVIAALPAGSRHVFSPGDADRGGWRQIIFGDDDTAGWVSARFLASDTAPPDGTVPEPLPVPGETGTTSVVCFEAPRDRGQIARVVFTDRVNLSGFIELDTGDGPTRYQLEGELDSGAADVVLTNSSDETLRQIWAFSPASVSLSDGSTMAVVPCEAIGQS